MDKVKILGYWKKYQILQKMVYFTNFKMFVFVLLQVRLCGVSKHLLIIFHTPSTTHAISISH